MGSIKNVLKFIFSPTASRTTSILVILIIAAAVPLTVFIAQKQQELRQRASENNCNIKVQWNFGQPPYTITYASGPTTVSSPPPTSDTSYTFSNVSGGQYLFKVVDSQSSETNLQVDATCPTPTPIPTLVPTTTISKDQQCFDQCVVPCQQTYAYKSENECLSDCQTNGPDICKTSTTSTSVPAPTSTPVPTTSASSPTTPPSSTSCPNGYNLSGTIYGLPNQSAPVSICLDNCKLSTSTLGNGTYSIQDVPYADHSISLQTNGLPYGYSLDKKQPNPDNIYKNQIPNTCTVVYNFTVTGSNNNTPTSAPTPIPGTLPCTNANLCSGTTSNPINPASGNPQLGTCTKAVAAYSCALNGLPDRQCWSCTTPLPTPTTAPAVGPGGTSGGNNAGTAGTQATLPTGQLIALNFRGVTLPGISSNAGSADLKLTFFRGDNSQQVPGGPFAANIARSTDKTTPDTFSGRSVFSASALGLPTNLQNYFIQISVNSYQAKILGKDGAKTNTEIQSQGSTGLGTPIPIYSTGADSSIPAVSLFAGDINNDGAIDGSDLGVIVACFGNKNALTDSAGRTTDCASKTQNRKFDADINKDGKVDGIDINLWARGENGVL